MFKKSSSINAALNIDSSTVRVLSTEKDPVVTGMKSECYRKYSKNTVDFCHVAKLF